MAHSCKQIVANNFIELHQVIESVQITRAQV